MGHHGSKLRAGGQRHRFSKTKDLITTENGNSAHEDFQGTTPETFEKLLAYMIDMAETDGLDLTSPSCLEHLKEIYGTDKPKSQWRARVTQTSCENSLKSQKCPIRQHSLESNGNSPRCSRSSREDMQNLKSNVRCADLSRQSTFDFDDDSDSLEDSNLDNSSHITGPKLLLIENMEETSFTNTSFREYRNKVTMINSTASGESQQMPGQDCVETFPTVLEDEILDRNLADILFSVEALWPGVRK